MTEYICRLCDKTFSEDQLTSMILVDYKGSMNLGSRLYFEDSTKKLVHELRRVGQVDEPESPEFVQ